MHIFIRWLPLLLSCQLFASFVDDLIPSTPDEIASLQPSLVIEDHVSALSGQPIIHETDLHIKAAQDLTLKRNYHASQKLGHCFGHPAAKRWAILPHLVAGFNLFSPYFQLPTPNGFVLQFAIQGNKGILKTEHYGMSNLRQGEPDSTADLRNIEFWYEPDRVRVIWPDGTERLYKKHQIAFRLETELLPNGKAIRYVYKPGGGLATITSTDRSGIYAYATITKLDGGVYLGSDNTQASFIYSGSLLSSAKASSYSHSIEYNLKGLLASYDKKEYPLSFEYSRSKGGASRIQQLATPSSFLFFSYAPPIAGEKEGWTKVDSGNGASTIYRFDKTLLLTAIENWHDNTLLNQKIFIYDSKQHVQRIETRDGAGHCLIAKHFECDVEGNPVIEQIETDCGKCSIKRTFASKGRLTKEERDDGYTIEYTYLDNTRLLVSKTIFEWGNPLRKTTYFYDEACNLIEEVEEGKTCTKYILNSGGPHLHRVQWKEEWDLNKLLIHKTHFAYDSYGNCSEESHFGSDHKLAYTIRKKYDAKGNLLEESNPLGQIASYQYDERNRCIHEVSFSGIVKQRTFDAKGRMILLKENDHITRFTYDCRDNVIEKTDYLGLRTSYAYHPVHRKPTLIASFPTLLKMRYDAFGREIERIDAQGAKTETQYNSYGSPTQIVDPDGGVTTYHYEPRGLLTLHTDPDGIKTTFSYDAVGRVVSKTIGAYTTFYSYDGYHLTEEIDSEATVTSYHYDSTGKKIEERRADRTTYFTYDALGFLSKEERGGRSVCYLRDVLGRTLEKSVDGNLKTSWSYDRAGHMATIKRVGSSSFRYDAYDRLIETTDEEGEKTTIVYEEGDQILVKRIQDPRNVETVETYNAHGLLLKREIPGSLLEEFEYDQNLQLIRQGPLQFSYTPKGLLASQTAGTQTTSWIYTPGGRLRAKVKPDGTSLACDYNAQGERIKEGDRVFQYDRNGRLIQGTGFSRTLDSFGNTLKEEFANGLWIESQYDDWDRPLERRLPDQSRITYSYEGPFLKKVTRQSHKGLILYDHRYDSHNEAGLVLAETGCFQTTYTYDKTGFRRKSQESPYLQEELSYDKAGNLIKKGSTVYTYDAASQLTSETDKFTAKYDNCYNCIEKNGKSQIIDPFGQLQGVCYDKNGNLIKPGFLFDAFDQLSTTEEQYIYDALGRRQKKGNTCYLYIDEEEIGSFEKGQVKELKVLGDQGIVAIEIGANVFAPIQDVQGTIRFLVDWKTKKVVKENKCDAFGCGLTEMIPYAYSGKRYDPKTGLIYFGKRYYDPKLGRWLSPDPLGPIDHSNLYQFVFNNPFLYRDSNGESIGKYLLGLGEMLLGGAIMVGGFGLELATFGGFTFGFMFAESAGAALIGHGLTLTTQHAQHFHHSQASNIAWKNTNPFNGPVDEDVITVDEQGNAIKVHQGNWLTGSKDGKWLQEVGPSEIPRGHPTGVRKDGGHKPGPRHPDPKAWSPHGHVPGITNPDGTPWLPIY